MSMPGPALVTTAAATDGPLPSDFAGMAADSADAIAEGADGVIVLDGEEGDENVMDSATPADSPANSGHLLDSATPVGSQAGETGRGCNAISDMISRESEQREPDRPCLTPVEGLPAEPLQEPASIQAESGEEAEFTEPSADLSAEPHQDEIACHDAPAESHNDPASQENQEDQGNQEDREDPADSADSADSADPFTCPICLATVKDPMVGRCGHMYCYSCIRAWWSEAQGVRVATPAGSRGDQASDHPHSRTFYTCPVCKCPLDPETDLISLYAGASSPTDSRPHNRGSDLADEVRRAQRRRDREQAARRAARRPGVQLQIGGFPGMVGLSLNWGAGAVSLGPLGFPPAFPNAFGPGHAEEQRGRGPRYSREEIERRKREDEQNPSLTPAERVRRKRERERAMRCERARQVAGTIGYVSCIILLFLLKAFLEQPRVLYFGPKPDAPDRQRRG